MSSFLAARTGHFADGGEADHALHGCPRILWMAAGEDCGRGQQTARQVVISLGCN